ncbi:MAG: hypothetical protein HY078_13510 [Elusimicrobia bacterium]|nr:hypothetical protein [Elusimicrobiota bacterium]
MMLVREAGVARRRNSGAGAKGAVMMAGRFCRSRVPFVDDRQRDLSKEKTETQQRAEFFQ